MARPLAIARLFAWVALAACAPHESPLEPLPPFLPNPDPSLNGTFYGAFNGIDGVAMLAASVQFTLAESSGAVAGTFAIAGVLDDGSSRADVAGTGTLVGTVASGDRADVSFTTRSDLCAHSSAFTGVYDRGTGVLGVDGQVDVLDQFCTVVYTYTVSLAMGR